MVALPTLEEEDAKRPSREREKLVDERTRIGNRIKATLARLGIRGFKPTLRTAAARLERLRRPEATLRREMARCACSPSRSARSRPRAASVCASSRTKARIR
jgi:transposase